jgi:uncharacterized protein YbaP (TraB family)
MARRFTHTLSTLLLLACASPPPRPPLPPCAPGTAGVPLAFQLRAPDGREAFLQGSVHFAREAEAGLDPRAKRALADADVLVGELDMETLSPVETARLMLELGRLPEGQRLQDVIAPETWSLLQERAKETGTPLEPFQVLEPWVTALTFLGFSLMQAGFSPEEGVELQVFASERPAETRGLETIGQQLALFDDLPLDAQEHMLLDALRPAKESAIELESMFTAWRCGDAATLEGVLASMVGSDPKLAPFYEATIFARNATMAKGLTEVIAESGRAFIVVGALHLVGARGIPALLEQQGFQVEQLTAAPPAVTPTEPPASP